MITCMTQSSTSASRVVLSAVLVSETAALERVSAVYNSFPGTCLMLWENRSSLRWKRRIRGGRLLRCFSTRRGARGLWSVSTWICFPSMKLENFSQAQVVAKASISICAY